MKGMVIKDRTAAVFKTLAQMSQKRVYVGIPQSENPREAGDPAGNAMLGFIHEKGSPARNIPARPFLAPGVKDATDKIGETLAKYGEAAFDNPDNIDKGLNAAGLVAVSSVKRRITTGEGFTPLKDATIEARQRAGKKGTKPLIRTGQLRNSITYVVRDK